MGISPSHTELEVPGDGSAVANFKVYYFSGDLKVSLVDIPLSVEPQTIHIERSTEPVDIELTIYGDDSLGTQVFDGYIRFLGMTGGTVAVAVKVKAKVTNYGSGTTMVEEPVLEEPRPEESSTPEESPPAETAPQTPPGPPPAPPAPSAPSGTEFPILVLAGIGAGVAIVITLIVVFARRKRY
ncbi:hypothetical protein ES703_120506 [subsurface metagenome]